MRLCDRRSVDLQPSEIEIDAENKGHNTSHAARRSTSTFANLCVSHNADDSASRLVTRPGACVDFGRITRKQVQETNTSIPHRPMTTMMDAPLVGSQRDKRWYDLASKMLREEHCRSTPLDRLRHPSARRLEPVTSGPCCEQGAALQPHTNLDKRLDTVGSAPKSCSYCTHASSHARLQQGLGKKKVLTCSSFPEIFDFSAAAGELHFVRAITAPTTNEATPFKKGASA